MQTHDVAIGQGKNSMKSSPQITTDLFDQELDRDYSEQLSEMVAIAQVVGLTLILVGLAVLKDLPRSHMRLTYGLFGAGIAALFAWRLYCWHDVWRTRWAKFHGEEIPAPMPEATRKTKVLRATLLLILLDSAIIVILIPLTGGPGKSVLDPLVPTIPIIAVILRQPKRTVLVALSSGMVLVVLALLHWSVNEFGVAHPDLSGWVTYTHRDPRHPISFTIVTGGALVLSAVELWRYNKVEVGRDIKKSIYPLVQQDLRLRKIYWSLKRGSRTWIKWLEHRDLPLVDLSLVHPPEDILRQAVVLSAPHWVAEGNWKYRRFTRRRIARHITFLTFAAHWIDDHFDALETYCQDEGLRDVIRNSSPREILDTHNPRLDELLKRMERSVLPRYVTPLLLVCRLLGLEKWRRALLPAHVRMVQRAVVRIIYGGLIQNAQSDPKLKCLLQQYIDFVQNGLSNPLKSVYADLSNSDCPLAAWVTSKVVMELLDCTAVGFSQDESEFFSLLYGPLLYYHDYKNEAAEERFGDAFTNAELPQIQHMVEMISRCFAVMPTIFPDGKLSNGRKLQLRLLLSMYGDKEKAIKAEYTKFQT